MKGDRDYRECPVDGRVGGQLEEERTKVFVKLRCTNVERMSSSAMWVEVRVAR